MALICNKLWVFSEDNINTDVIFPGKHTYTPMSPEEMAKYAMEDYDSSFATTVQENDVIVTGRNFGCGSSREQAVTCLKMAGIKAIIGKSFARIYFRNAINQALLLIESVEAADYLLSTKQAQTQPISIDTVKGIITVGDKNFSFPPLEGKAIEIFEAGGLVAFTKRRIANN
jgi:3-isopropylmalate/(R)-2-methylmalate dehydratase small subunit